MIVLSIDPGSKESAWIVGNTDAKYTDKGRVIEKGYALNDDVLLRVEMLKDWRQWADSHVKIDMLALEVIQGYGIDAGETIFETCWWGGVFSQAFGIKRVQKIGRKEVKLNLTGRSTTKDKHVQEALRDLYGEVNNNRVPPKGPLRDISGDQWAALGVFECFAACYLPALIVEQEMNEVQAAVEDW